MNKEENFIEELKKYKRKDGPKIKLGWMLYGQFGGSKEKYEEAMGIKKKENK